MRGCSRGFRILRIATRIEDSLRWSIRAIRRPGTVRAGSAAVGIHLGYCGHVPHIQRRGWMSRYKVLPMLKRHAWRMYGSSPELLGQNRVIVLQSSLQNSSVHEPVLAMRLAHA
jgi:hypothetical protein